MTTAQAWDDHVALYDSLFATLTGFVARSMFRMVEARLPAGAEVLDIACGSGALTLPAVEREQRQRASGAKPGRVFATDFAAGMVDFTRKVTAQLGAGEDVVRCSVENGQALSFADASFDAVFSCFGIFLFEDRQAGWREAARVLRPGGTFATAVWQGPEHNAMMRAQFLPVIQALPQELVPQTSGGWLEISEAAALISEVNASNAFEAVSCKEFHASVVLPSWRHAWEGMKNNPVMGLLLRRCNAEQLQVVEANVRKHLSALAGGEDQPLVLESVCNLLTATKRS